LHRLKVITIKNHIPAPPRHAWDPCQPVTVPICLYLHNIVVNYINGLLVIWFIRSKIGVNGGTLNRLLEFVEEVRDNGNAVRTSLVTVELFSWAPELAAVGFVPLCNCVL